MSDFVKLVVQSRSFSNQNAHKMQLVTGRKRERYFRFSYSLFFILYVRVPYKYCTYNIDNKWPYIVLFHIIPHSIQYKYNMDWQEIVFEYVCPVGGCFLASSVFAAPINDLNHALRRGSLGSLNTTPWAVMTRPYLE